MYNPYLGRWFCADPAMQLLYAFCGNNPIVNVDPDGEFFLTILSAIFCPALLPAAMGIDMSTMQGGMRSFAQGDSFWSGAWKGALTGFASTGLSVIGGSGMSFAGNLGLGIAEGAAVGALDAALWGGNIGNGMLSGAGATALLTTVTSENMSNLSRGEGFKTNSRVFDQMIGRGTGKQDILDYFGFKGEYNPNVISAGYDTGAGNYWGVTRADGTINYGNNAFENYATLKGTYIKETYHSRKVLSGEKYTAMPAGSPKSMNLHLEEMNGYNYAYRKQGLFSGHSIPFETSVHRFTDELTLFEIPFKPLPSHSSWIYKIPRRW